MVQMERFISNSSRICRGGVRFGSILFVLLLLLMSCKKKVHYELNVPKEKLGAAVKSLKSEDAIQSGKEGIDASVLKVEIEEVSEYKLGDHTGLNIRIKREQDPDFYQFYICNEDNTACNPEKGYPGKFVLASHHVASPPSGNLVVNVRACVHPESAKNKNVSCGVYASVRHKQSESGDKKMQGLLEDKEGMQSQNIGECTQLYKDTVVFYRNLHAGALNEQTDKSLKQSLEVKDSLACEMIFNSESSAAVRPEISSASQGSTETAKEESKSEKEDVQDQDKPLIPKKLLVPLGVSAIGIGAVGIGLGVYHFKISKLFLAGSTTENENSSHDLPESRLDLISSYKAVLDRADPKSELGVLLSTRKNILKSLSQYPLNDVEELRAFVDKNYELKQNSVTDSFYRMLELQNSINKFSLDKVASILPKGNRYFGPYSGDCPLKMGFYGDFEKTFSVIGASFSWILASRMLSEPGYSPDQLVRSLEQKNLPFSFYSFWSDQAESDRQQFLAGFSAQEFAAPDSIWNSDAWVRDFFKSVFLEYFKGSEPAFLRYFEARKKRKLLENELEAFLSKSSARQTLYEIYRNLLLNLDAIERILSLQSGSGSLSDASSATTLSLTSGSLECPASGEAALNDMIQIQSETIENGKNRQWLIDRRILTHYIDHYLLSHFSG